MVPAVSEVIRVKESVSRLVGDLIETNPALVDGRRRKILVRNSEADGSNLEFV
jgi:hypothetical protein